MKRSAILFAALVGAAVVAAPLSAQIYQWKDASGKTVISDKPPMGNVREQKEFAAPASEGQAKGQKSLAERDMEFRQRQKQAQENAEKSAKEERATETRREACVDARRQLATLESGERIALRDGKGERYYMDEAQRQQETDKTRQFIESNCR